MIFTAWVLWGLHIFVKQLATQGWRAAWNDYALLIEKVERNDNRRVLPGSIRRLYFIVAELALVAYIRT